MRCPNCDHMMIDTYVEYPWFLNNSHRRLTTKVKQCPDCEYIEYYCDNIQQKVNEQKVKYCPVCGKPANVWSPRRNKKLYVTNCSCGEVYIIYEGQNSKYDV